MQYLVAGRLYQSYDAAREYANFLARISRIIFAVEAVTDDFEDQMRNLLKSSDDQCGSP